MSWTALHSSFTSRSCGCSVGSAWQLRTLLGLVLCSLTVISPTLPGVALAETEATEATPETQPPFLSSEGTGLDPVPSSDLSDYESALEPVLVTDPDLAAAVSDLAAAVATLQETSANTEDVSQDGQSDEPADSEQEPAGTDSGRVQEPSQGEASRAEDVAGGDDEAQVRELDYESPESILYAGLGLCCGSVLGAVYSLGVSTSEQRCVISHE